jgi:hypothetical protein
VGSLVDMALPFRKMLRVNLQAPSLHCEENALLSLLHSPVEYHGCSQPWAIMKSCYEQSHTGCRVNTGFQLT